MSANDKTRVHLIAIAQIRIANPRVREKEKFDEIVESISKVGLKKPVTVTATGTDAAGKATYDLICGQGRLEAFIALQQTEIPAFVRGMSTTEGMLASLVENIARRKMSALDQMKTVQWMKEQGHTAADIAAKTGLTEGSRPHRSPVRRGRDRISGRIRTRVRRRSLPCMQLDGPKSESPFRL